MMARRWLAALLALGLSGGAAACTLWGAAGEAGSEGTLLVKNRDWRPDHVQSLRLRRPANGYAYLGLYADGGDAPGIKAGVNEKGLAVVSASASSLPRATRLADSERRGVMAELLRGYASLDEAAAAGALFSRARPAFLLLADRSGLMLVEIGQGGRYRITRQSNGALAHTNHYFDASLLDRPQKIGDSSRVRLARIQSLLQARPTHDLAEFGRFSQDRHDGPDDSLWRTGKEHTLASWQMALPPGGAPRLRLILANPGEPALSRDYLLDARFWAQAPQTLLP
ncbi:hypothetical protein CEK28_03540 [Xenophilus sp. AP218F]|nr:hypothetical protein CEK28_03540 [Xenophilus sp. AP218F]